MTRNDVSSYFGPMQAETPRPAEAEPGDEKPRVALSRSHFEAAGASSWLDRLRHGASQSLSLMALFRRGRPPADARMERMSRQTREDHSPLCGHFERTRYVAWRAESYSERLHSRLSQKGNRTFAMGRIS